MQTHLPEWTYRGLKAWWRSGTDMEVVEDKHLDSLHLPSKADTEVIYDTEMKLVSFM